MFYLKEVTFTSPDPTWSQTYLGTPEARLTALLKHHFGNSFWETYSQTLLNFHSEGRLLLRIKSILNNGVVLTQVWRSREDSLEYLNRALQGQSIRKNLEALGLTVVEVEGSISEVEVQSLLLEMETRQHIIQFLIPKWRKDGTKIGDPLKEGKMYLPFPEDES